MQTRRGTPTSKATRRAARWCAALGLVGMLSAGIPGAVGPGDGFPARSTAAAAAAQSPAAQPAVSAPRDAPAPLSDSGARLVAAAADDATAAAPPAAVPQPQPVDPADAGAAEQPDPADELGQADSATTGAGEVQAPPTGHAVSSDATGTAPTPAAAPGVVTGTLTRLWAEAAVLGHGPGDGAAQDDAELQVWLETSSVSYRLRAADVQDVADGAQVTARLGAGTVHPVLELLEVAQPAAVPGGVVFGAESTDSFGVAAAAVTHDVTLVLAVPAGSSRDSRTPSALASTINGAVSTYWSQQSRGTRAVRVVSTHGWLYLSRNCSDATALWDEVASRVGWQAGARKHLVVYLPQAAGCGSGLGTVGSGPDVGGRSWVSHDDASIIAHELGHNMGLGHSNGLLCASTSDATYASGWSAGCAEHGYRDYYDVMGVSWGVLGSLAAPHAESLGLLTSTEKLTTTSPKRVKLLPMTGSGLRVLRIDDPGGAYYVEYRTPTSWDSWLSGNNRGLDAGVIVHRRSPYKGREAILLDGSVTGGSRTDDWRSALPAGATLTTASGRTAIRVESADASGATIAVAVDGVWPGAVKPPTNGRSVQVQSPSDTTLAAGTTVFSGVGTAPEGTLLWQVTKDGVVKGSGHTAAGSNGEYGEFTVPVSLPAGTYTFTVQVPDDSDDEAGSLWAASADGSSYFADSITVSVR